MIKVKEVLESTWWSQKVAIYRLKDRPKNDNVTAKWINENVEIKGMNEKILNTNPENIINKEVYAMGVVGRTLVIETN